MALPFHNQDTHLSAENPGAPLEDATRDGVKIKYGRGDIGFGDNGSAVSGTGIHRREEKGSRCCSYCECSKRLSRTNQNLARGFLFLSTATALAYIPEFQAFAGEAIEFFVVLAAVMGSRPVAQSNLGWQNMMFINILLAALCSVVSSWVIAVIAQGTVGGLVSLFFVSCTLAVWWGNADSAARLPIAIFVLLHVQLISAYGTAWHGDDRWEVIFNQSLMLLFVVFLAVSAQFILAALFFPWTANHELVQKLALTFEQSSKLLLQLRLRDEFLANKGCVGREEEAKRRKVLQEKMESSRRAAFDLIKPSYYELRWCFNGRGTQLWNFYKAGRLTTRLVLHAAIGIEVGNSSESATKQELPSLQLRAEIQQLERLENAIAQELKRVADALRSMDASKCDELDRTVNELTRSVETLQKQLLHLAKREFEVLGDCQVGSVATIALRRSMMLKNMLTSLTGVSKALVPLCRPAKEWTVIDWAPTLPSVCLNRYKMRVNPVHPTPTWKQQLLQHDVVDLFEVSCERQLLKLLKDDEFRTGVKAAFGSTILLLLGLLIPELLQLSLANAIASLLSALRVVHLGLAYERAFLRIAGVGVGYVLAGTVFSICGTALDGYAIVLVSIPLCGLLMLGKKRWSKYSYLIYSSMKELLVITLLHYLKVSGSAGETQSIWEYGGFIALFSLLGVILGVIIQAFCFPVTGEKAIRKLMSQSLFNMDLALEMYLFSTHSAPDLDINRQIDHHEYDTAYLLFMKAPGLLKSLRYERLHAKREDYVTAIEHLRKTYHALWVYRRFRGSLPFLLGDEWKGLIHPETMQMIVARKRLIPAALMLLANALRNNMPLPFLKPLLACPKIFLPFLRINQKTLLSDRAVIATIRATRDPATFLATGTTNAVFISVSQNFAPLYDFVQTTSHQRPLTSQGYNPREDDLVDVLESSAILPLLPRRASL